MAKKRGRSVGWKIQTVAVGLSVIGFFMFVGALIFLILSGRALLGTLFFMGGLILFVGSLMLYAQGKALEYIESLSEVVECVGDNVVMRRGDK